FNMYLRAAHPAQHQVVQIDFFHQGLAAIVLDRAVGSGLSRASGGDESAQWSGKRADVISAGIFHVADDECPHRTQFAQGNVDGDTAELPAKHSLDNLLRLAQRTTGYHDGPRFRKGDTAFAIDGALQVLRTGAPVVDHHLVAGPQNVIRANRKA